MQHPFTRLFPSPTHPPCQIALRWVFNEDLAFYDDDALDAVGEPPNQLLIAVLQARGLPVMDRKLFGGGSSDPVVKIELCGEEGATTDMPPLTDRVRKTTVRKSTLTPVWNESFAFTAEIALTDEVRLSSMCPHLLTCGCVERRFHQGGGGKEEGKFSTSTSAT